MKYLGTIISATDPIGWCKAKRHQASIEANLKDFENYDQLVKYWEQRLS